MRPEFLECTGFSIHAINRQTDKFVAALPDSGWDKLDAAMQHLTRCLRTGAPVVGRAEKVAGSALTMYEVKITPPGSKGPQLRLLCAVQGELILCARGIVKRERKLRRADVEAAEKALRAYLEGGDEGAAKPKRGGSP